MRRPHEPAFTVESFAMMHTVRPSIVAVPVTTPSAGSSRVEVVGERRVLDERPGIDELADAIAREELPALAVLLVVLRGAALFDAAQDFLQLGVCRHAPSIRGEAVPHQG